jgi:hypothetical protein
MNCHQTYPQGLFCAPLAPQFAVIHTKTARFTAPTVENGPEHQPLKGSDLCL